MPSHVIPADTERQALLAIKEAIRQLVRVGGQMEELVDLLWPDEQPPLRLVKGGDDA